MLTHTDDWTLKIHFWPRAAAENVRPKRTTGLCFDDNPAVYAAHGITFSNPPTRDDFIAVVNQTPWMHTWKEDLLPIITQHPWPMVAMGFKGASTDMANDDGRQVGLIEVCRGDRYVNAGYSVPSPGTYPGSAVDRLIKRRIRGEVERERAREHVQANRNVILERLVAGDERSEEQMLREVARVLLEGGIIRPRRTARVEA